MSFAEDLTCKNCGQFICVLDLVTEAYNEIVQCLQRGDFEDIEFATQGLMEVQCDDCNHSVDPEDFAEWVASNIKIGSKIGFDILGQKPMIMNVWEESEGRYRSRRTGRIVEENFESVAYEYLRLKATKEFEGAMTVTSEDKEFYLEVLTGEPAQEFYEGQDDKAQVEEIRQKLEDWLWDRTEDQKDGVTSWGHVYPEDLDELALIVRGEKS